MSELFSSVYFALMYLGVMFLAGVIAAVITVLGDK